MEKVIKNRFLGNFHNNESGNLSVMLAASLFTIIIAAGGAIDMSNVLSDKTHAQLVADSAVLQAASEFRDSTNWREARTSSYDVAEQNFSERDGSNNTKVRTKVKRVDNQTFALETVVTGTTQNAFLAIIGMDETKWIASASSVVTTPKIEVVLVLDISHSMKHNTKMDRMKAAAVQFIEDLDPFYQSDSHLTVSIIPFGEHVNFGDEAATWLASTETPVPQHSSQFHGCFRFNDGLTIGNLLAIETSSHIDNTLANSDVPLCPNDNTVAVLHSSNGAELTTSINNFEYSYGTGSDIALLWGSRIFDPAWRNKMVYTGVTPPTVSSKTKKYIVLLTDGGITHTDKDQNGRIDKKAGGVTDVQISAADSQQNFLDICADIAGEGDINLYTIGYEPASISAKGKTMLESCTAGAGNYYEATASNISTVFSDISRDVNTVVITN